MLLPIIILIRVRESYLKYCGKMVAPGEYVCYLLRS